MVEYEKLPVRTKAGLIKTVGALVPMSAETLLEKEIEMPEEIVKGLLPVGAAILAGAPKSGKSYLVMTLVLAVAAGKDFLGYPTKKSRVLYLDLETPMHLHQKRMEQLTGAGDMLSGVDVITQSGRDMVSTLGEGFEEQISAYLDENPDCKVVVIDTLGEIMTAGTLEDTRSGSQYAKEKEAYDRLIAMARNRKILILVVDHTTKIAVGKDPFMAIRGTYATAGSYDTLMVLSVPDQKAALPGERIRRLSVKGKAVEEQDIRITFDAEWGVTDVGTSLDCEKRLREAAYKKSEIPKYLCGVLDVTGSIKMTASELQETLRLSGFSEEISADKLGKWLVTYADLLEQADGLRYQSKRSGGKRWIMIQRSK